MRITPSQYYIECLKAEHSTIPENKNDIPLCLQNINRIQGTKPEDHQCNRLLNYFLQQIKSLQINIDNAIYVKFFQNETTSYPTVSKYEILQTTENSSAFEELRDTLDIKV